MADRTKAVGWVEFLSFPPFSQISKHHLGRKGRQHPGSQSLSVPHVSPDGFCVCVCGLRYSPRQRHSLPALSEPFGLYSCHRQLYQRLFHPPIFREPILETSGRPQLTCHLNSSVSSLYRLQKESQNQNSPSPYVPPNEAQALGSGIIQCLEEFLSLEIFLEAPTWKWFLLQLSS